ncbi:MAG: glycosyltransferase family 2 protein [Lentisphaerae bacterium]|nr:glycosyltransferase family 2 protein [Lentisphaerota bacterium]
MTSPRASPSGVGVSESTAARYVLITPTKNEEALIGTTIECVVNQTRRPEEWVIVSDGSTDRTNEIARAFAQKHPWIRLLVLPSRPERNFAAVVRATEAGLRALSENRYQYLGLLDSDVRIQPDYFERVIERMELSPSLGLAGGMVIDVGTSVKCVPINRQDVPGAVQFFRRTCFEGLNGLIAVPEGGWDGLTCAQARMHGFKTELFTDLIVDHLKPRNVAEGHVLRRRWQMGARDYALGYYPLFELVKCLSRSLEFPPFVGSAAWFFGYCAALARNRKRVVPRDLLAFIRDEQKSRLFHRFPFFRHRQDGVKSSSGNSH